jgi:hypothetical protein
MTIMLFWELVLVQARSWCSYETLAHGHPNGKCILYFSHAIDPPLGVATNEYTSAEQSQNSCREQGMRSQ